MSKSFKSFRGFAQSLFSTASQPRFRPLRVESLEDRSLMAVIPAGPSGFPTTTANFAQNTPTAIPTGPAVVTSTVLVAGAGSYLLDVNLTTFLQHTFPDDLDVTIASPAGTVVTLTTDNGDGNDDVFNGTFWDDGAGITVTDATYVNLQVQPTLTPEEALGAFIGEDPNGTWTITISDDLAGDGGSLNSWSLDVTTLAAAPVPNASSFTNNTPVPTVDVNTVTSTIVVSGIDGYLLDANVTTFLQHTFAADLDITLTSPAGTTITLTTDNGAGNDNVFDGTVWDDDANPFGQVPYTTNNGLVTDHAFVNATLASPLVPEQNLAAFIGENPNGVWTLTITDDLAGDIGVLNSWTLDLQTLPQIDFGDAPATYGTLAPAGAGHIITGGLFLGANVDSDTDGQPSAVATGDDTDVDGDDENGVTIAATLIAGSSARVTVTASAGGFLDAWIDFNRNGTFEAAERIANSHPVVAGANTFAINVPLASSAGLSFARFRVSTAGGLGPTGLAADGEVEDYAVTLFSPAPGTVQVIGDPQNPGQNVLLVSGTSASDSIVVLPVAGNPAQVQVLLNGQFIGPFAANTFSRIEILGRAGDDSIVVDPTIFTPTTVRGGVGNDTVVTGSGNDTIYGEGGIDTLIGGAGHDIVLGGADNDFIHGGEGNDILIGGLGSDWLYGEGQDDLMIGGNTTHDGTFVSLNNIRNVWSSGASFNTRVATLLPVLSPGTVINDGAVDFALGSLGRDWLLDYALLDQFLDFDPNPFTGDRRN